MSAHRLGPIDLVPSGEGRTFRLGGASIAVFRTRRGGVFATQARCPHKRGPIADGLVGEGCVICPLHGRRFDLATGAGDGERLRTYPVTVEDGDIVVDAHPESESPSLEVEAVEFVQEALRR